MHNGKNYKHCSHKISGRFILAPRKQRKANQVRTLLPQANTLKSVSKLSDGRKKNDFHDHKRAF